MSTYQQFFGRFEITSALKDFAVTNATGGPWACALATGYTYIRGYTGEATARLCEDMQAKIRAADASLATATVSYYFNTGRIELAFDTPTDITWTDTALQTLLGFTGNQTGSASYTATNQPRYVWRPTRGASEYPLTLVKGWQPRSSTVVYRSGDGTVNSVQGTTINEARVEWTALPEADVLTPSTGTVYRDLQQFWSDIIAKGIPLRYQPDRSDYASTSVFDALVGVEDEEGGVIGSFAEFAARNVASYNGLWDVSMFLWKSS